MSLLKQTLLNTYVRTVRLLSGVDEKKVLFASFSGKSYSDNPKAVSEALHEMAPDAKIVWLTNDPENKKGCFPDYVRLVDVGDQFAMYKEMATAAAHLTNFNLVTVPKSKKQMFIQTWHGDRGFKKILHDSTFFSDKVLAEEIDGYCDLAVAGSKFGEDVLRTAFWYKGRILLEGTPRNDALVEADPLKRAAIRQQLKLAEDVKVLLYAPTLRRQANKSKEKQQVRDLDISATLTVLEKRDGCKWMCLLRAHPAMVGLCGVGEDSRILDVSGYEDMADLLLSADMLITDYSSCAGDFVLLNRPLVLFHADRQEYLEKDRTFYFDMEQSPFMVAEDQDQLETIISELTPEKAVQNCKEILAFYGTEETGHAAHAVAGIIKDWIYRKK